MMEKGRLTMSLPHSQEQTLLFDLENDAIGIRESSQATNALSHGGFWTASISEWPNEDDVYTHTSLSEQVRRTPQDASFYLTPEACAAILERGSRNGMRLDPTLEKALSRQAGL
jgi:hypothetical protein